MIYHIVSVQDLKTSIKGINYGPAQLDDFGFIHCASAGSVLPVANDYFSDHHGPLLLLRIDPARLSVETRFEVPVPIEGGGTAHLQEDVTFPHVYGPIDLAAIMDAGLLKKGSEGYRWPDEWHPLDAWLPAIGRC